MAYRVDYDRSPQFPCRSHTAARRKWLTVMVFCIFLFLTWNYSPVGREVLQRLLIPGDPEQTLEAAQVFTAELRNGVPLSEAARAFCVTVFSYGPAV